MHVTEHAEVSNELETLPNTKNENAVNNNASSGGVNAGSSQLNSDNILLDEPLNKDVMVAKEP